MMLGRCNSHISDIVVATVPSSHNATTLVIAQDLLTLGAWLHLPEAI
jgi:hypothetical protein